MRSGNAANALCELTWSLIGIWSMGLVALSQTTTVPNRISMSKVIHAFQHTIRNYRTSLEDGDDLVEKLESATIDTYHRRSKKLRNPTILTRNYRASRKPRIEDAAPIEIRKINKLKQKWKQERLTA